MLLHIKAKPNAKSNSITKDAQGTLHVRIAAPAVDGKANKKLLEFLAKTFHVSIAMISLVRGETSSLKTIRINITEKELEQVINTL